MSYSAVDLQGFFFASGSPDEAFCNGAEYADNGSDYCCHPKWWNNGTYTAVKGRWSGYFLNEMRVYHLLGLMLTPDLDRGFATALHRVAYDGKGKEVGQGNLYVEPAFVERVARAAHNYALMYPGSRWYSRKKAVETDCAYYSVWETKAVPYTEARFAALENAVGKTLPVAYKNAMKASGQFRYDVAPKPQDLETWLHKAIYAVDHVPGSDSERSINYRPNLENPGVLKKTFAIGGTGSLGQGSWLDLFLNAFAPPVFTPSVSKAWLVQGMPSGPTKLKLNKSALVSAQASNKLFSALKNTKSSDQDSYTPKDSWTSDPKTMVAIAAVALGAVLIWNNAG